MLHRASQDLAAINRRRIQLPLNLVLLKNVSIIGIFWGSYSSAILSLASSFLLWLNVVVFIENNPQRVRETWTELLGLFGSGRLKPVVYGGNYTLETLTQGLQDLENRKTWGKAVVRVREPAVKGKL